MDAGAVVQGCVGEMHVLAVAFDAHVTRPRGTTTLTAVATDPVEEHPMTVGDERSQFVS